MLFGFQCNALINIEQNNRKRKWIKSNKLNRFETVQMEQNKIVTEQRLIWQRCLMAIMQWITAVSVTSIALNWEHSIERNEM